MKNKTQQHTPTPWHTDTINGIRWWIMAKEKYLFESVDEDSMDFFEKSNGVRKANAAFVVRAVNSHEALLSIAQNFLSACDNRLSLLEDDEDKGSEDVAEQIEHWKAYRKSISKAIKQATGGK